MDTALAALHGATSPYSIIQFRGLGDAMVRVDKDATAFAHRDQRYFVAVIAIWLDAAEDERKHRRAEMEGLGAAIGFRVYSPPTSCCIGDYGWRTVGSTSAVGQATFLTFGGWARSRRSIIERSKLF